MTEEHETTLINRMRHIASIVLSRWWLVLLCIVITGSAAYVYLGQQTPIYRATSTVVISQRPPQVMDGIKEVTEVVDGTTRRYREYITTQLDVIRSHAVAEELLDRLNKWDDPLLFGEPQTIGEEWTVEEIRRHRAATLAEQILARDTPDSMIVEISFESSDPELAALVATTAAEVYRDQNLHLKIQIAQDAGTDLAEVVNRRLGDKEAAEKAVEAFEAKQNVGTLEGRLKDVTDTLELFNQKLREATAQRISLEAELEQVQKLSKRSVLGISAPQVLDNTVINELKLHYVRQQTEVAGLRETYGPKHPKLVGAQKRLAKVASSLRKEVRAILKSVQMRYDKSLAEEKGLQEEVASAQKEADAIAIVMTQSGKLQKNLKNAERLYEQVLKRHQETRLTAGLAKNNIRLLNRALVPTLPIRPRKGMVLTLAALLGLAMGVVLSLLLETADTTIRSKTHAEEVAQVPCLGLVPSIEGAEFEGGDLESRRHRDLYVYYNSASGPAEMGRTLRTNLLFLSAERKLKTLLVTSPLPQEGKTTVTVQTSIALAMAGGRTLLVEADLRRPRLAETFTIENDVGMSLYLADHKRKATEAISKTEVEQLDVAVCGPIPPNPAELLGTPRFDEFLQEVAGDYDTILIDSPPVNAVADALIISSRVDGVLLVAKSAKTTTEVLRQAQKSLQSIDAPLLGLVLNDMNDAQLGYYRHRYYRKNYYSLTEEERQARANKPSLEVVKS